jgi:hypothetical protein
LFDRVSMATTMLGPVPAPDQTPGDLSLVWEPASQTLYGEISPNLYPALRMQPQPHFVIGEPAESPMHLEATGGLVDPVLKVVNGPASFVFRVPYGPSSIEESAIAPDGTIWFIAGAVDRSVPGPAGVHFWLAHFDATNATVNAVELPATHADTIALARLEGTRTLTADNGRATIMRGTEQGLVLDTYQL